jgi:tetratricopeptide (TPR) repeat protein
MAQQLRSVARTITLAAAAVFLLTPAPSFAQNLASYTSLIDRYVAGDADGVVRELSRWSRAEVTQTSKEWVRLAPVDRLPRAVMLHTEVATALAIGEAHDSGRFHMAIAQGLAQRIVQPLNTREREQTPAGIFARRWHELAASVLTGQAMLDDADYIVRSGLSLFPRAPMLYVARGVVREERVNLNILTARGAGRTSASFPGFTPARLLDLAAADYRHAIELDSARAMAYLRLGWLHLRAGDGRAENDFDSGAEHATDDRLRYLFHLLRGLAAEKKGQLDAALKEYDAALAMGGSFQTAYVAVSRVNEALGRRDRARAVAQAYSGLEEKADDPWWDFNLGGFDVDTLAWLRAEARRP